MTRRFQPGDLVRVKPEHRDPDGAYPDMVVRFVTSWGDVICRRVDWETAGGRRDCIARPGKLEKVQ